MQTALGADLSSLNLLAFHLELVHLLLAGANSRKCQHPSNTGSHGGDSPGECRLVHVTEIALEGDVSTVCAPSQLRIGTVLVMVVHVAVFVSVRFSALLIFMNIFDPLLYDSIVFYFAVWLYSIVSLHQNSVEIFLSGPIFCNFTTGKDYTIAVLGARIWLPYSTAILWQWSGVKN